MFTFVKKIMIEKHVKVMASRMRTSTIEALRKASQKEDRSISYIIERAVRRDLKVKDKP